MRLKLLILICALAALLAACVPATATATREGAMVVLSFTAPDDGRPSQGYSVDILGEGVGVVGGDASVCEPGSLGLVAVQCLVENVEAGETVVVIVTGAEVGCVWRPVFGIEQFPCEVRNPQ